MANLKSEKFLAGLRAEYHLSSDQMGEQIGLSGEEYLRLEQQPFRIDNPTLLRLFRLLLEKGGARGPELVFSMQQALYSDLWGDYSLPSGEKSSTELRNAAICGTNPPDPQSYERKQRKN